MMKRIENIDDLVLNLEGYQLVDLKNDLKIRPGETISVEEIQKIILDTCHNNTGNLRMMYEDQLMNYYSIYEIEFTEEFQDDVYYRNKEWLDILFFLFQLYGYHYIFDCSQERLYLEPSEYIDFFNRVGIYVDPFQCELIDTFFFHENEKQILSIYQKEKRTDKIKNLIDNIKMNT